MPEADAGRVECFSPGSSYAGGSSLKHFGQSRRSAPETKGAGVPDELALV